jgi:hypothetical protein
MANQQFEKFNGTLDATPEFVPFNGTLDDPNATPKTKLGDLGRSLKSGVEQLPGIATGLADIVPALAFNARPFSKAADAMGNLTGFKPGQWSKDIQYSDAHNQSGEEVGNTWKGSDAVLADPNASKMDYAKKLLADAPSIASAYATNPMYTANQVVQSLPAMAAGGVGSKLLMGAGRVAGAAGTGYLERAVGNQVASEVAGAASEGLTQAGQAMDDYKGEDNRKGAIAALGSGIGDAAIAMGSGHLAHKMGLETSNTAMAKAGDGTMGSKLSAAKRILGGAASEGILQELPQSMQEQVFQNYAEGKPLGEGVVRQGLEGAFSGAIMGGGANVIVAKEHAPVVDPTIQPVTDLANQINPVEPPIAPITPAAPSQQMGINTSAGVLSRTAAQAVDGSATTENTPLAEAQNGTDNEVSQDTSLAGADGSNLTTGSVESGNVTSDGLVSDTGGIEPTGLGAPVELANTIPTETVATEQIQPEVQPDPAIEAAKLDSRLRQSDTFGTNLEDSINGEVVAHGRVVQKNDPNGKNKAMLDRYLAKKDNAEAGIESASNAFDTGDLSHFKAKLGDTGQSFSSLYPKTHKLLQEHVKKQAKAPEQVTKMTEQVPETAPEQVTPIVTSEPKVKNLKDTIAKTKAAKQAAQQQPEKTHVDTPIEAKQTETQRPQAEQPPELTTIPPEYQAAQNLIDAIDKGGMPMNAMKINKIARDLGMEAGKKSKPAETIQRIRDALARQTPAEAETVATVEAQEEHQAVSGVLDTTGGSSPSVPVVAQKPAKKKTGGETSRDRLKKDNPFMSFLATHGVNIQDRSDVGGEKGKARLIPGHGPLFRKKGLRLDELAIMAHEEGFLTDAQLNDEKDNGGVNALSDMINRALGNEVVTPESNDPAVNTDKAMLEEAHAVGIDTTSKSADQVYDAIKAHYDTEEGTRLDAEFVQVEELLDSTNYDTYADLKEHRLKTLTEELEKEEHDNQIETRNGQEEVAGSSQGTDETTAEQAQGTDGQAGRETFSLNSESAAEATARVNQQEQAARDSAAEQERLDEVNRQSRIDREISSRQDTSADNFTLGAQVNDKDHQKKINAKRADDQLAGQGDIFSQPEPVAPTKPTNLKEAQEKRAEEKANTFISAPDGSTDFGEITKEMAKTMRRQDGKIRLQSGNEKFGLRHIEARHGEQIKSMGFSSTEEFIYDAIKNINSIWKPEKTSKIVAIESIEKGKAVFIQLKPSDTGDFYTINTAFPVKENFAESKKGWELLWGGVPVPSVASGANSFAVSQPNAGVEVTVDKSQSSKSTIAEDPKNVQIDAPTKIDDIGEKIGGARKDNAVKGGTRTAKTEADSEEGQAAWKKRYSIVENVLGKNSISYAGGTWSIFDTKTGKVIGTGYPRTTFPTEQAAKDALPLVAVAQKHRVVNAKQRSEDKDSFEIIRDVTDRKRMKVVNLTFDTREEAMRYMAEHAEAIIETKTNFGEEILAKPDSVNRIGENHRTGDVKGEDFKEVFGFRGVEFGNWNNQEERQEVLNHAYDGLMDLAKVLDIPHKAISLNGDLALSFGARGQGLSGARAHYERSYGVINLTKMSGAGVLAHEWMHAFDHYLGRQDGKASSKKITNDRGDTVFAARDRSDDYASHGFKFRDSGVRAEVIAAYEDLMKTMYKKAETYVQDTKNAEKFVGQTRDALTSQLNNIRKDLSEQKNPDYYKRNNKPASNEQLIRFDAAVEKLVNGEDLETQFIVNEGKARSRLGSPSGRRSNASLDEVSAVYKEVRGRTGFTADGKGTLDGVRSAMSRYQTRIALLKEANDGQEKQKSVPTDYSMNARRLDDGRSSDYWTTAHEMIARAFSAYVEDKIKDEGNSSQFLSFGSNNNMPEYVMFNVRPFPAGEERLAINKGFDKLIDTLETKETDKGTALFSKGTKTENTHILESLKATLEQALAPLGIGMAKRLADTGKVKVITQAEVSGIVGSDTSYSKDETPKAFFNPKDGITYLIADAIDKEATPKDLRGLILHEVANHALKMGRSTPEFQSLLKHFAFMKNGNKQVQAAFDRAKTVGTSDKQMNEEALGYFLEANPDLTFTQRVIAWFRDALRSLGFKSLSTNDIIYAAQNVLKGHDSTNIQSGDGLVSYSKGLDVKSSATFKKWFGESKVVDDEGKPLVVYHGTGENFNEFSLDKMGSFSNADSAKGGFFFTDSKPLAEQFKQEAQRKNLNYGDIRKKLNNLDDAEFKNLATDAGLKLDLEIEGKEFVIDSMIDRLERDNDTSFIDDRTNIDRDIKRYIGKDAFEKGNVVNAYLSINNPMEVVVDSGSEFDEDLINSSIKKAKLGGYDGLVIKGMLDSAASDDHGNNQISSNVYIAFTPTQIKSATGNNGQFDASNQDIRYSHGLGATLTNATNNVRDVNIPAGYKVADLFDSAPSKVNWWHKTVGTPYNLSRKSTEFKKVFDSVQSFINDVSYYGTEAGDLAPNILQKLESWKDIAKKPLSPEDTKALSTPVFEGTLIYGRNAQGKAMKMTEIAQEVKDATAKKNVKIDQRNAEKTAHLAKYTLEQKKKTLIAKELVDEKTMKMWLGLENSKFEKIINNKFATDAMGIIIEKSVTEPEADKEGVVFTPAELKEIFNLTGEQQSNGSWSGQIGLYQEFRKATDKSLKNLAISDMLRFVGKDASLIKQEVMDSPNVEDASAMLRDHLMGMADNIDDEGKADTLRNTADDVIKKGNKAKDLMDRGYAPLSRFGQYTLDVVHEGKRVYFGMFETEREANKMARQMAGSYPGATMKRGTVSEQEYKLFSGVSPETLALFGDMLGKDMENNEVFQKYLQLAKSNRSSMKRLIERKGIAGFSEDSGRVLAGFVLSNARQTSNNLHMGEMEKFAKEIDQQQGELKDQALNLVEYVKNPREEAQALRGLLFAQYIGGSVASAMVNMTQPMTMTFPWLSQFGGVSSAAKQMAAAMKDQGKKTTGDAGLDAALHRAEETGVVSPQEVHQLMQQSMGNGVLKSGDGTKAGNALAGANNALSRVMLGWGKLFSVAEQFNRRVTFIAAYRTAVAQGMSNPEAFAERAIAETQGLYNKGNKPAWARGAIGATLFTFKQYSIAYVEMLGRMAKNGPEGKKAALLALGVLFLISGAGGMPGADDLDDVISGALQAMGYNFDSRTQRRQFFATMFGEGGANFLEHGVSGLPGSPIDVSGRMGLGNLIPGTGLLTKKTDHTSDVAELAGPAGDLVTRGFNSASKAIKGEFGGSEGAIATLAPQAIKNLYKSADMLNTGMYRDQTGKKVISTDTGDAISKAIGFQPHDVKQVQDTGREVQRMIGLNKMRESEISGQWAQGIFEKDIPKVQAAREELAQWNRDNPDSKININFSQIIRRVKEMSMDKATRLTKSAPKEIRNSVRQELLAAKS